MTGLHRFSLLVWWVYSQGQTITLRSLSFSILPSGRIPYLGLLYDSIFSRARRSVSSVQVRVYLWFSDSGSLRSGFQFSVEHALSSLTVSPYAVQKVWTKLQYYQHQQSFLESRAQSPDTRFVPTATDVWCALRFCCGILPLVRCLIYDRIVCTEHLMVPTYITALNVYVCVVPDTSSESCSLISTTIGVIFVGKNKDEGYCKVVVPATEMGVDAAYEDAIPVLSRRPPRAEQKVAGKIRC